MKQITAFFKSLRVVRILTVLVAGFALLLTTACSNVTNPQGARPNVPSVQMGGNNNPHKNGGDGYTNYKMSTDPKVNKGDRAEVSDRWIAAVSRDDIETNSSRDLLYPGSSESRSNDPDIGPAGERTKGVLEQQTRKLVPEQRQPVIQRTDPNERLLEKTGKVFEDASRFIKEGVNKDS